MPQQHRMPHTADFTMAQAQAWPRRKEKPPRAGKVPGAQEGQRGDFHSAMYKTRGTALEFSEATFRPASLVEH